ncbi:MAG: trp operon repressor [Holosporaceae bacterium]|jgi:TrpR-related protein YerC/YecD|nr:trp operon repressor [Holosporaceae bacterium]
MDHHYAKEIDLFETLALIGNAEDARNFLADLCTPSEIRAFSERWKVCQLLSCGKFSYRQIKEMAGASLTTIGRVARFLNEEKHGGYKKMLEKTSKMNSKETPPGVYL